MISCDETLGIHHKLSPRQLQNAPAHTGRALTLCGCQVCWLAELNILNGRSSLGDGGTVAVGYRGFHCSATKQGSGHRVHFH